MELRLTYATSMFPHQNLMLFQSIITSCHPYEKQFQVSHHTSSTLFIMPLMSKITNDNREQLIKHIPAPISLKL